MTREKRSSQKCFFFLFPPPIYKFYLKGGLCQGSWGVVDSARASHSKDPSSISSYCTWILGRQLDQCHHSDQLGGYCESKDYSHLLECSKSSKPYILCCIISSSAGVPAPGVPLPAPRHHHRRRADVCPSAEGAPSAPGETHRRLDDRLDLIMNMETSKYQLTTVLSISDPLPSVSHLYHPLSPCQLTTLSKISWFF